MTSRDSCQTHVEKKLIKTTKSLEIRSERDRLAGMASFQSVSGFDSGQIYNPRPHSHEF